jgi:hypothetical protein
MRLLVVALLAPLIVAFAATPEGTSAPAEVAAPKRCESLLRFYSLKGKLQMDALRSALGEIAADISCGPLDTGSRTGSSFVAIRCGAGVDEKALERALKKGGVKVEPLAWSRFEGRTGEIGSVAGLGPGYTQRDFVTNMSGELRWFEALGADSELFFTPGKLRADEIADRYAKLHAPFGGGKIGELRRERFSWKLAKPVDPKLAAKLVKALEKVPGVEQAEMEAQVLNVTVQLHGLLESAPSAAEGSAAAGAAPRAEFCPNALLDLLESEGVEVQSGG